MKEKLLARRSILFINLCVLILDQTSKCLANNFLQEGSSKTLIPGLLNLRLVSNTGAAFSLLSNSTTLLGIISFFVTLGLIFWIWKLPPMSYYQALGVAFLLGGTLGNGLDRWRVGYVTDFLELAPIEFPIFNLADIAINCAVILFILHTLRGKHSQITN